jgi:hypothetical protein
VTTPVASAVPSIVAEFPEWEVAVVPAGPMWSAYWQSEDGRHRRYVVAPSAAQLLGALRGQAAAGGPAH